MASITKKIIHGKPYYYARECRRIDGKPKIVWQKYLGRADDIIQAMTQPARAVSAPEPEKAIITEFGAVVALYDLAQRLHLCEFIDRHVPKAGPGPSVGTYLVTATLNRCVDPRSKAGIAQWFQETALRRLLPIEARQLTSQRFWDNMDRVDDKAIEAIERDVTRHLVREFEVDLRRVLFDATNFFTFIDTFNERSTLAQRGKSKEGRRALRIVGLALLVSADFHLPLLHRTYPGNQPDAPTFKSLTDELVACYRPSPRAPSTSPSSSTRHFIGSLVPTQHPDLLEVSARRFRSLADEGLPGVEVYRTQKEVFGVRRTVLVTYNENLFVAQLQTLLREIAKRQRHLRELQNRLRLRRAGKIRGGRPPTVKTTQKKVDGWLKARHMKDLFQVEVEEKDGLPVLSYRLRHPAWRRLQRTLLGKTLLFTDNEDWSDAEIVRGYRSQHHVEDAFRSMKDPHHISLRPQYHWTDQKIKVHVFCCVLALTLSSLLRRELHRQGIDRSIPDLLENLGKIREVGVVYPPEGRKRTPTIRMTVSDMTADQQALYDALNLGRYLST